MKVVVAGGTGFLGRPLVEALAVHRHDVVVLTRRGAATPASAGARAVHWVQHPAQAIRAFLLAELSRFFGDGAHLPRAGAGGEDEEIGDGRNPAHVEDDDVAASGVGGKARQLGRELSRRLRSLICLHRRLIYRPSAGP